MILQAANLNDAEARFLVSDYYAAQDMRKRTDMQVRHQGDASMEERISALSYMGDGFALMEDEVRKMLKKYAEASPVGRWMLSLHGIGPVIAAGMLAHLDIKRAPTAGHFWRFSGLDPTCKWEKGKKRPYNPAMKQLCFHFGECAKRTSGSSLSFYGQFYKEKKQLLEERNEAGEFAERAKTFECKSTDWKKVLKQGKLPAGNIDRQACNQTAKMFLSHLHAVMFWEHFNTAPPKPFTIAILGHAHEVKVPNIDMFPGFEKAYYTGDENGTSGQRHTGRPGKRSDSGVQRQKPGTVRHQPRVKRASQSSSEVKEVGDQG
jgi:Transposase IS116/IS110/IS902 family